MAGFALQLAHLLGGAMLVLSFVLLYQRRLSALITVYALQAWALGLAAAALGVAQGAPHLLLVGFVAVAAKGVAIPLMLRVIVRRLAIRRAIETALGVGPSMILGVALVALSILVVMPVTLQAVPLAREDLATALSVVMLGLVMMISRRSAISQVIGFMALENGLILAAIAVPGMPLIVELSVAFLVMLAFIVAGIFVFHIRARFDSIDVGVLDRVGGVLR